MPSPFDSTSNASSSGWFTAPGDVYRNIIINPLRAPNIVNLQEHVVESEKPKMNLEVGEYYRNRADELCYVLERDHDGRFKVLRVEKKNTNPTNEYYVYSNGRITEEVDRGYDTRWDLVSFVENSVFKKRDKSEIIFPEFSIGTDPEMILKYKVDYVNASHFMICNRKYEFGEFGVDGHSYTAEWRPKEANTPLGLVENLQKCFIQAVKNSPGLGEMKWCAGGVKGGHSIGGHIHFGMAKEPLMAEMLNRFLAGTFLLIENPEESKMRKNDFSYGKLGDCRDQPWGWEYRTLSSWIVSPMVSLAVLSTAKHIINQFKIPENDVLQREGVRRALKVSKIKEPFESHDVNFWREFHDEYWSELMSWPIEPSCRYGLQIMKTLIDSKYQITDTCIKNNWGVKSYA